MRGKGPGRRGRYKISSCGIEQGVSPNANVMLLLFSFFLFFPLFPENFLVGVGVHTRISRACVLRACAISSF